MPLRRHDREARLRAHDLEARGLARDRAIRRAATLEYLAHAEVGRLLALVERELQRAATAACLRAGAQREQHRHHARLRVVRAAPVELAALPARRVGLDRPAVADRNRVEVRVEQEARPATELDRGENRVPETLAVDAPAAEQLDHVVGDALLRAGDALDRDQRGEQPRALGQLAQRALPESCEGSSVTCFRVCSTSGAFSGSRVTSVPAPWFV